MACGSPRIGLPIDNVEATVFDAPSPRVTENCRKLGFLGDELHFTVSSQRQRRKRKGIVAHSCSKPLPKGSVVTLDNGIAICSPELTFVQMGTVLSVPQLACFGMALCGIYAVDPFHRSLSFPESSGSCLSGLPRRKQLIAKDRLASFAAENARIEGSRRARAALRLILERSRSPMESVTAIMLSAPVSKGGFALPAPLLNCRVKLPAWLHRGVRTAAAFNEPDPYAECDFVFSRGKKLVLVDYHGEWSHSGEKNIHHDSLRSNAFADIRLPYFTITKRQFFDLELLEKLAAQIQSRLGIRKRIYVDDPERRRRLLHDELSAFVSEHSRSPLEFLPDRRA